MFARSLLGTVAVGHSSDLTGQFGPSCTPGIIGRMAIVVSFNLSTTERMNSGPRACQSIGHTSDRATAPGLKNQTLVIHLTVF